MAYNTNLDILLGQNIDFEIVYPKDMGKWVVVSNEHFESMSTTCWALARPRLNQWFHNEGFTQLPEGLVIEYKVQELDYDVEAIKIGRVAHGAVIPSGEMDYPFNWARFSASTDMIMNYRIIGLMNMHHGQAALLDIPRYKVDDRRNLVKI